jgi:hypothetical protein
VQPGPTIYRLRLGTDLRRLRRFRTLRLEDVVAQPDVSPSTCPGELWRCRVVGHPYHYVPLKLTVPVTTGVSLMVVPDTFVVSTKFHTLSVPELLLNSHALELPLPVADRWRQP